MNSKFSEYLGDYLPKVLITNLHTISTGIVNNIDKPARYTLIKPRVFSYFWKLANSKIGALDISQDTPKPSNTNPLPTLSKKYILFKNEDLVFPIKPIKDKVITKIRTKTKWIF